MIKQLLSKILIKYILWKNGINSSNLIIRGLPLISNRGQIRIGKNVSINSSLESNPVGGFTKSVLVTMPNGSITIGNDSGMSNSVIVSWQKVEIGNHVLIGADCKIYDTDFHSTVFSDRVSKKKMAAKTSPVKINDGVFIGTGSIILKGVTIGAKSIIAAGSVVSRSIPENEIWGGNPAKFIRKLTTEERQ